MMYNMRSCSKPQFHTKGRKVMRNLTSVVVALFVFVSLAALTVVAAPPRPRQQDSKQTERRKAAFLPKGFDYVNPLGSRNDNETRYSNTRSSYKSVETKAFLVTNVAELAEVTKLIPGSDISKKINVTKEPRDRVLFIFGGEREVPYQMEVKQVHLVKKGEPVEDRQLVVEVMTWEDNPFDKKPQGGTSPWVAVVFKDSQLRELRGFSKDTPTSYSFITLEGKFVLPRKASPAFK